jgi:hypothetical protein
MEQNVNYPATTTVASGGYTSGSGVLNVGSTAAPFPASGTFRVVIQSAVTGEAEVLLEVTAVNSGTQWAVTAEGVDGNANAGDNVYAVLSAGALAQLRSDASLTGPFASLPVTVPLAGTRYKCTDAAYEFISNGSAWLAWFMGVPATVPPVASGFTVEGSGSLASSNGALIFTGAASAWSVALEAVPSVPYSLIAGFSLLLPSGTGGSGTFVGICHSDGTKYKYLTWSPPSPSVNVQYNSALNSFGSATFTQAALAEILPSPVFLKITIDSSYRTYYVGDGVDWVQIYQESATADLVTSKAGLVVYGGNGSLVAVAKYVSYFLG